MGRRPDHLDQTPLTLEQRVAVLERAIEDLGKGMAGLWNIDDERQKLVEAMIERLLIK